MHPVDSPAPPVERVRARAILPEHAGYAEACAAWNLAADQRPAAVVIAR